MRVVLDSDVILADPWMRGTQFGTLIDGLRSLGGQIAVPTVVVEEVVNKYGEQFKKARDKALVGYRDVQRLLAQPLSPPELPNSDAAQTRYRTTLLARIKEVGGEILPIPDISHEDVLARALARLRPFSARGGYRDCLIWETVLQTPGVVCFVTRNKRDFAEGDNLHSELARDLERTSYRRDGFEVAWGVSHFNEAHVLPHLRQVEEVRQRLETEGAGPVDLHEWIRTHLQDYLVDEDLLFAGMGMPDGAGSAGLPRLTASPKVEVEEVWERKPGRYLVRVTAELPVTFIASFEAEDYARYEEVRNLLGEHMPPGSSATLDWTNEFILQMLFTVSREPGEIVDWDVEEVSTRYLY